MNRHLEKCDGGIIDSFLDEAKLRWLPLTVGGTALSSVFISNGIAKLLGGRLFLCGSTS